MNKKNKLIAVCKICSNKSNYVFTKKVLDKYDVKFYRCINCNFIQTEKPFWLNEAYKNPITQQDTGLLYRNIVFSQKCPILFNYFSLSKNNYFLDWAGGYGVLTRLMKDQGYNFEWDDIYTSNIFAKGLEKSKNKYAAITCFECFEHIENPVKEFSKIFNLTSTLFFTTELVPRNKNIDDWYYLGTPHGQHISFYSLKTLKYLAKKYSLNLYSDDNFHILTKKNRSDLIFKILNKTYFLIYFIFDLFRKINSVFLHNGKK